MNRCVICDYTQETGSELLNTPSSINTVVFRAGILNAYYCDECYASIRSTARSFSEPNPTSNK